MPTSFARNPIIIFSNCGNKFVSLSRQSIRDGPFCLDEASYILVLVEVLLSL